MKCISGKSRIYLQGTCLMTSNLCLSSYKINLHGVCILSRVADYLQTSNDLQTNKNKIMHYCPWSTCFDPGSQTLFCTPYSYCLKSLFPAHSLTSFHLAFRTHAYTTFSESVGRGVSYVMLQHWIFIYHKTFYSRKISS